jgi:hypothetical protein
LCSNDSRFESVCSPVETVVAVAQVGALDSREEALAVFFGTVGLFAVAAALQAQFRLLSTYKLQLVHKGVGILLQHCLSCLLPFVFEVHVVTALIAGTLLVAKGVA